MVLLFQLGCMDQLPEMQSLSKVRERPWDVQENMSQAEGPEMGGSSELCIMRSS